MHSFEHKQLLDEIVSLDKAPEDPKVFSEWIEAKAQLEFLDRNADSDLLVVHAIGKNTFVHSVVVQNDRLSPIDQQDLLRWNVFPSASIASYTAGGGRDDIWIERGLVGSGSNTLNDAVRLVFSRTFEGWTGPGRTYYEINQEFAHLTEIHWRPEKRSYCLFNDNGDLEPIVSIANNEDKTASVDLVSFKREQMEEYLAASNSSLVRMFDFTLLKHSGFSGWGGDPEQEFSDSDNFFYRRRIMPEHAAYTRGIQIIRPRRPSEAVFTTMKAGWFGEKNKLYAEFTAFDWRNDRVSRISTDPAATTNYFEAKGNTKPFELSAAFFRPEVLTKYKGDRDKYTVSERDVSCRASWRLEGIDVNEAGQIHAYICDLHRLPYEEQLHWVSFNEPPKTSISQRALVNDFEGKRVDFVQPLRKVLTTIERWHDGNVVWWKLRDEKLLERVNTPLTESRDEWAEAFMDLAKLVVEGFEIKAIRVQLDATRIQYDKQEKSIVLLERLINHAGSGQESQKLSGLRTVQHIRSKAKGHAGGNGSWQLGQDALMTYETFADHFRHVCEQVADELATVESRMTN